MITGQNPYDLKTASTFELQTKIVNEKLHLTSTIFDSIIALSTEKELASRFKNCNEVKVKFANLHKSSGVNYKNNPIQDTEKTLVDRPSDNTIVESPNKTNFSSKSENISPHNNPIVLIVIIMVIIVLGIIISNNSSSNYQSSSATDSTEMIAVDTFAVDSSLLSAPYVSFQNNSYSTVYLAYAYWDNGWETTGWYEIDPQNSFGFSLPSNFAEKSIYWYAINSEGAKYEGSDDYFCIDPQNAFHYYTKENCNEYAGFYRLDLTGSNTTHTLE